MSKIETRISSKVKVFLCTMCGLKAKHVAEVNNHTMCARCFSEYIEDRVGSRRIKMERTRPKIAKPTSTGSRKESTGNATKTMLRLA